MERGKNERGMIEMVDTESLEPAEHMLRQADAAVDFERTSRPGRGLSHASNWVRLKFAAMNLKKMANWKARSIALIPFFHLLMLHDFAACLVMSQAGRSLTG